MPWMVAPRLRMKRHSGGSTGPSRLGWPSMRRRKRQQPGLDAATPAPLRAMRSSTGRRTPQARSKTTSSRAPGSLTAAPPGGGATGNCRRCITTCNGQPTTAAGIWLLATAAALSQPPVASSTADTLPQPADTPAGTALDGHVSARAPGEAPHSSASYFPLQESADQPNLAADQDITDSYNALDEVNATGTEPDRAPTAWGRLLH